MKQKVMIFFKFTPYHLPKRAGQMVQNSSKHKGGPLDEKIFFSTKFSDLDYSRLFFLQIFLTNSKNIYISVLCIMQAPFSLRARYVHRAQRQKGACLVQNPGIYMFLESVRKIWKNEPTMVQIWELVWRRKNFHPRVPPLCSELFWTICPARFGWW